MLRSTIVHFGASWVIRHRTALQTVGKFAGLDWQELGVDLYMRLKGHA